MLHVYIYLLGFTYVISLQSITSANEGNVNILFVLTKRM